MLGKVRLGIRLEKGWLGKVRVFHVRILDKEWFCRVLLILDVTIYNYSASVSIL